MTAKPPSRRHLLCAALATLALPALAQTSKILKIIVPFATGGANDVFARQMAKLLSDIRAQPVVVENKPGAGGNVGTELVVRSVADGTTLLLGHTGTVSINPALYGNLKFDTQKDLLPVAMFASSALVLVVPAALPAKTIEELLALAAAKPGGFNYGSSGNGTGSHLSGELLAFKTGVKLTHVPYKGTAPALTDLVGGQVQFMFSVIPPALALIKSGRLRAIAVTGSQRLASMPEVPTLSESSLPGLALFESSLTYGLLAPRGTPEAMVKELSAQVLKAATSAEFQTRLNAEGAVLRLGNSADYAAQIRKESAQWAALVKLAGVTAE